MISDPTVTGFYKQCSLLAGFRIWSRFSSYFSIIFCMSWSAPITLERRGWTLAVADTIKLGFFSAEQNRITSAAKLGYSYGFAQAAFCWEFGIPWKAPQLILQAIPVKSPSNCTAEMADPPLCHTPTATTVVWGCPSPNVIRKTDLFTFTTKQCSYYLESTIPHMANWL